MAGAATADDGLFAERTLERQDPHHERPDNLRALDPASEYNREAQLGISLSRWLSESVVTPLGTLSAWSPAFLCALPAYLRLAAARVAFLGHGLAGPMFMRSSSTLSLLMGRLKSGPSNCRRAIQTRCAFGRNVWMTGRAGVWKSCGQIWKNFWRLFTHTAVSTRMSGPCPRAYDQGEHE
jgi:hypothetical protein